MNTKILYLILLLAFSGCGMVDEDKIIHNFYITSMDDAMSSALSYRDSTGEGNYTIIVQETVFAVGYNHHYIIAKQHPHQFAETLNRSITNYYILPLDSNINEHSMYGPLTLEEFESKKKELNITSIAFTKVYHDLE